ncbi:hypothetical protein RKD28_000900 [Streptomyces sp. SAI-229]
MRHRWMVSGIMALIAAFRDRYSLRCATWRVTTGVRAHHDNTPIGVKIPPGGRS